MISLTYELAAIKNAINNGVDYWVSHLKIIINYYFIIFFLFEIIFLQVGATYATAKYGYNSF